MSVKIVIISLLACFCLSSQSLGRDVESIAVFASDNQIAAVTREENNHYEKRPVFLSEAISILTTYRVVTKDQYMVYDHGLICTRGTVSLTNGTTYKWFIEPDYAVKLTAPDRGETIYLLHPYLKVPEIPHTVRPEASITNIANRPLILVTSDAKAMEEESICEAVVLFQIPRIMQHDVTNAFYALSVKGVDPDEELVAKLRAYYPSIMMLSKVLSLQTNRTTNLFVDNISWASVNRVYVNGGYRQPDQNICRDWYMLEKQAGIWSVKVCGAGMRSGEYLSRVPVESPGR